VAQALILIPVVRKTGIKISPRFDWRDSEMKKSLYLASWTLLFAAISHISYLITVNLSTRAAVQAAKAGITTGVGFSPYNNALFVFILPHSVVTLSIVTALLPQISAMAQARNPHLVQLHVEKPHVALGGNRGGHHAVTDRRRRGGISTHCCASEQRAPLRIAPRDGYHHVWQAVRRRRRSPLRRNQPGRLTASALAFPH
jgi:hypothetical protein